MKLLFPIILLSLIIFSTSTKAQVSIDTISLVSNEAINTQFCFNNTKLMDGNNNSDRYIVYYNPDSIFLNVNQSKSWTRKTVYTGSNISSATLAFYKDTIWVCWKEGIVSAQIKARYSVNKGNSWSSIIQVSAIGKVASPSIYAASNGKIHFTWSKESSTDTTVFYTVYNRGILLATPIALSNPTGQGLWPSLIAVGDTILCSWKEAPLPTKVWFRSSYNGGVTWNAISSLPTTIALPTTKDPNLAYAYDSKNKVHYLYLSYDGQNNIYLQRSTDFGNSWSSPQIVSNQNKLSQFAHIECNNNGFVGISYEQRPIGTSLFDDTKKDVGFTYSTNWGNIGSFSIDTLAYTLNRFGSAYPGFNKIDENNFYLAWLTKDTISNKMKVFERLIHYSIPTAINWADQNQQSKIAIFPNPFFTNTTIKTDKYLQKASLIIFNLKGQKVKEIKNFSGFTYILYRENLPAGMYIMQILQDNKVIVTEKILVS